MSQVTPFVSAKIGDEEYLIDKYDWPLDLPCLGIVEKNIVQCTRLVVTCKFLIEFGCYIGIICYLRIGKAEPPDGER